ncbi:MAG TPA: RNA polymerase sigma-70 factor [Gemmatimonadaceae bacterium]
MSDGLADQAERDAARRPGDGADWSDAPAEHQPLLPSLRLASGPAVRVPGRAADPTAKVIVDDRTLLAQMRAGEGNAITLLFERYYDALCTFAATYVASDAEAEEVVEDVFHRVWETREQLEIRDSVKAYLYAAVRNHALNRVRRGRAERRWLDDASRSEHAPGMGEGIPGADEALQHAELMREVTAAIDNLPPRCRQVFLLHRQHALTYIEIGAALEISPRTVENLIARALRHLRKGLAHLVRE